LIDLNVLVSGMVDLLRRSLGATIEIEPRLAKGLPMITVDPGQVENALLNLAVNARDAMPNGGHLTIETRLTEIDRDYLTLHPDALAGKHVMLAVTDTGMGMSPEVREHAFEPFYTTKGPGAGSGLGLSMVYGFVKQSGGHVQLYSELGHGTTIRVYLPAQGTGAVAAPATSAGPPSATSGERILVVEDDPRVRRVAVRRLKELGYATVEAESGPAALRLLDEGDPFDLLFTDVVMAGGMSGIDLAKEVQRRRPKLKVLFTSGYAEPVMAKRGRQSVKSADWLSKPYSLNELQAKLREVLGR
jgi:CheY-like chemotaxis protein